MLRYVYIYFFILSETSATKELGLREFVYIAVSHVCATQRSLYLYSVGPVSNSLRHAGTDHCTRTCHHHVLIQVHRKEPPAEKIVSGPMCPSLCVSLHGGVIGHSICAAIKSTHNVCWRLVVPSSDLYPPLPPTFNDLSLFPMIHSNAIWRYIYYRYIFSISFSL